MAVEVGERKRLWSYNTHGTAKRWAGCTAFVCSLFLCSVPIQGADVDPFFSYLVSIFPAQHHDGGGYVRCIGSVVVVWSVLHWEPANKFFSNSFSTYLGKISFALYLVHGAVIRGLFDVILPRLFVGMHIKEKADMTMVQVTLMCVVGLVTCLPVCIAVSDWFWQGIDAPVVSLCRWIDKRLLGGSRQGQDGSNIHRRHCLIGV